VVVGEGPGALHAHDLAGRDAADHVGIAGTIVASIRCELAEGVPAYAVAVPLCSETVIPFALTAGRYTPADTV
jgi:hypothetical protein